MLKRFIPIVAIVSILVSMLAIPSLAAETAAAPPERSVLDYTDLVTKTETVDHVSTVSVSVSADKCGTYISTSSGAKKLYNATSGTVSFNYEADCYGTAKFCFPGLIYSDPRNFMSLDIIPDGTPLRIFTKFFVDPEFEGVYDVRVHYQINYYNAAYGNIAVLPAQPKSFIFDSRSGRFEGSFETSPDPDNAINIPSGAKYFGISLVMRVSDIKLADEQPDQISYDFGFSDWSMELELKKTAPEITSDFVGSIGTFFTSSMAWLGDVVSVITSNAPLLVLTFGMMACGFVLFVVARIKR